MSETGSTEARAPQPPSYLARRLSACRSSIRKKALDGYLVTGRADQYYLTGFDGEDGAALILPRRVWLLTDGRFAEEAERRCPWASTLVREGALSEALARLVRRHRLARIGFEPAALTVGTHATFRKAIHPARLVASPRIVEPLRVLKDAQEIAQLRRAIEVAESAFRAVTRRVRPGMTERELAADLQHEMIRRGATGASFPIIVAVGSHSSLPHAVPGDRKIRSGSAVLIDWGAVVGHYRSDLTRMLFVHRIPPRFERFYNCVREAQETAIRMIAPGVRMCDVDSAARDSLRQAGLDDRFTHSLGHGLGLDIHEPPRLGPRVTGRLEAGMVVTVEPGVYWPGVGGVRIEDDVLVTEAGCKVLSGLSKDLDTMVV